MSKKKEKWLPNLRFRWECLPSFPGTYVCHAITDSYAAPIGILWFSFVGIPKTLSIIDIHVNTHFRRCRIATKMLDYLNETWQHESVTSGEKSSRKGVAWMKAFGFKQVTSGLMKGAWVYKKKSK